MRIKLEKRWWSQSSVVSRARGLLSLLLLAATASWALNAQAQTFVGRVLPDGTSVGAGGLTEFQIDADNCNAGTGGTDYNCTIDQEGAFDFVVPYGPGTITQANGAEFNYTGTVYNPPPQVDGGLSGCEAPIATIPPTLTPQPLDTASYVTGSVAQNDDPWPTPDPLPPSQTKTDFCILWQAAEIVNVDLTVGTPSYPYNQNETILYVGVEINTQASGDKSAVVPLFAPITLDRVGGERVIEFDLNPNGSTNITTKVWNDGTQRWVVDTGGATESVDCVQRGDEAFFECALNLTLLGIVPDSDCVDVTIPGVLSRTGNSQSAQLKDIVLLDTPIVLTNCGAVRVAKEVIDASNNTDPVDVSFTYRFEQEDLKPSHDLTLLGDGPQAPAPPVAPDTDVPQDGNFPFIDGALTTPTTVPANEDPDDIWDNVIGEPDYTLKEVTLPPDPNAPTEIWEELYAVCEYTDIFATGLPRVTTTVFLETAPTLPFVPPVTDIPYDPLHPYFPIPLDTLADGTVIPRTDCTITNILTPITLGYFKAQRHGGSVTFNWQTTTETGNRGFHLYTRNGKGWQRITDEMIPAQPGDSFDVREYTYEMAGVEGKAFGIGDVPAYGKGRIQGPFALQKAHGVDRKNRAKTDWTGIRASHDAKKQAREEGKKLKMQQKLERQKKAGKGKHLSDSGRAAPTWVRTLAAVGSLFIGSAQAAMPVEDPGLLYIDTQSEGIHRVTHAELMSQGVDLTGFAVDTIQLSNQGQPVPVYVRTAQPPEAITTSKLRKAGGIRKGKPEGGSTAPAVWGADSYLEFVAEKRETLYSKTNVYVLDIGSTAVAVSIDKSYVKNNVSPVSVYQAEEEWDYNLSYSTMSPNGDPWFATSLSSSGAGATWSFPFWADDYAPGAGPVELQVDIWGFTAGPHNVEIGFSGQTVADAGFNGISPVALSGTLDGSAVQEGYNEYSLTISGRGVDDDIIFDKWRISYPRQLKTQNGRLSFTAHAEAFQVSGLPSNLVSIYRVNPDGSAERLTGYKIGRDAAGFTATFVGSDQEATYHVASDTTVNQAAALRVPAEQPDMLLGNAAYLIISHPDFIDANLEDIRIARASQFGSAKTVDVEAVYGHFGGGLFDPQAIRDYISWAHDNLGTQMVLLVGSDVYDYHDYLGNGAMSFIPSIYATVGAMTRFAPVDAKYVDFDDNNVPDLPIGRLIPRTAAESASIIAKTFAYDAHSYPDTSVFAADIYDPEMDYSFSDDSDLLIDLLPDDWEGGVTKAYLDDADVATTKATLLSSLNGGVALASYVGHSGPRDWTFEGLFSSTDAAGLTNTQPTIVTQWGCWNTFYASPSANSLGHELTLNGQHGAAAVLGAVALTSATNEKELAQKLYQHLFTPGTTMGDAILQAKQEHAVSQSQDLDVILGWNLLGDPALIVNPNP